MVIRNDKSFGGYEFRFSTFGPPGGFQSKITDRSSYLRLFR